MDQLVWNAARRLAWLVAGTLAVVGSLLVRDVLSRRSVFVASIFAAAAMYLILFALVAMAKARRFLARPDTPPPPRRSPYRDNAQSLPGDPPQSDSNHATRVAATALIALALAESLVVVAAASR
jgi:hypothetical protein